MGGSKTTQQQQQSGSNTTNWGYQTPPTTSALQKVADTKFGVDPSLKYQFQNERTALHEGFNNPMGADYNPTVKDAIIRGGEEQINQDEAKSMQAAEFQAEKLGFGRDVTVAGMEQPQLVQTGGSYSGSGSGTSQTQQSPWGSIMSAGATAGSMSL